MVDSLGTLIRARGSYGTTKAAASTAASSERAQSAAIGDTGGHSPWDRLTARKRRAGLPLCACCYAVSTGAWRLGGPSHRHVRGRRRADVPRRRGPDWRLVRVGSCFLPVSRKGRYANDTYPTGAPQVPPTSY